MHIDDDGTLHIDVLIIDANMSAATVELELTFDADVTAADDGDALARLAPHLVEATKRLIE